MSVRQIRFTYSDSVIKEGIGQLIMKGDTVYYADLKKVRYTAPYDFRRLACND